MELNKIYNMDNLELMKQIDNSSIDLIYCDILYNTGKSFNDYDDNLGTPHEAIEWYNPRLVEMKRILKDTGSIYLQCDYRLVHYLKIEMDNIFDLKNFRNEIIWSYSRWTNNSKDFTKCHDTILRYSKSNEYIFNKLFEPFSNKSQHKGNRISTVDINGKLDQKYTSTKREKAMRDVWDISILNSQAKERVGYDTQKPKVLLERIINASSNNGDLVADFFCGSGTACVVAKENGRNYIGCDISEKAVEITKNRLEICT